MVANAPILRNLMFTNRMKAKEAVSIAISLIGFYSIYSAMLLAGIPFASILIATFQFDQLHDLYLAGLMTIPQFCVPFGFGLILVWRSRQLASWLVNRSKIDEDVNVLQNLDKEFVSIMAFSLLGIYILANTVPNALKLFIQWFSYSAQMSGSISASPDHSFWDGRSSEIVYHISAIGFGLFVFMRSKSITRLIAVLRKTHVQQVVKGNEH